MEAKNKTQWYHPMLLWTAYYPLEQIFSSHFTGGSTGILTFYVVFGQSLSNRWKHPHKCSPGLNNPDAQQPGYLIIPWLPHLCLSTPSLEHYHSICHIAVFHTLLLTPKVYLTSSIAGHHPKLLPIYYLSALTLKTLPGRRGVRQLAQNHSILGCSIWTYTLYSTPCSTDPTLDSSGSSRATTHWCLLWEWAPGS